MVDVKTQEKEREADDLKSKPEAERDGKILERVGWGRGEGGREGGREGEEKEKRKPGVKERKREKYGFMKSKLNENIYKPKLLGGGRTKE